MSINNNDKLGDVQTKVDGVKLVMRENIGMRSQASICFSLDVVREMQLYYPSINNEHSFYALFCCCWFCANVCILTLATSGYGE